jgi:tetratricopeptide (TPR) repeat protein
MKLDTLSAVAASVVVWLVAFPTIATDKEADKTDFAIGAICRAEQHDGGAGNGKPLVRIESGMGDGGFPVATSSRAAQQWFDYGIKLFHAFYHEDARQAFDNAAAADPRCALCLWGQALSRGPTQNFDASDEDLKAGLEFARKAQAAARTEREKILTAAMVKRYSRAQDVAAEREFASELLKAEAAGPSTPDLRLLAAEALMTGFRRGDHTTASEAEALLEPVLQASPQNTAAIHYYIHATEFAGKPALALAYAEQLSRLAPKASHLVHMAAHTYIHVGRYEDAATINAFALQTDAQHLTDTATPGPLSTADYYEHNLIFGMAGTLMSGDRALALRFADHLHRAFPDKAFNHDGASATEGKRYLIYARYDPARLLSLPEPPPDSPMTQSLYHYARGEAYAVLHDATGLAREAALVKGDKPLFAVARNVLAGRLAILQGRFGDAAKAFEAAANQQDTLLVTTMDPPPWWYPVRRSVAVAWLKDGKFEQAEKAAQASLSAWPGDPMALLVLSQAEDALGHAEDARHAAAAAVGGWEGDIAKVDIAVL